MIRHPAHAMPVIDTQRLQIALMPLEVAEALVHGHRPAGVNWPDDYPTDSTLVAASMLFASETEGRPLGPWSVYQMVRKADGRVVGGLGFVTGGPDPRGHVQLAFSVPASERGQGYAAEAVGALVAWARRQPGVTRVLAETAGTNMAVLAVYEAAGMRRAGADGNLVFFEG
jgi:RimJ/RimL family protein N-acetyltransferase